MKHIFNRFSTACALFLILFCVLQFTSSNNKERNNALIVGETSSSPAEDEEVTLTEDVPKSVFKPSRKWKPVEPGQAIPKGLHVRINLATGQKEAKLLDDSKETEDDGNVVSDPSDLVQGRFSAQELKEALKAIKAEDMVNLEPQMSKSKFRSLEELKKEFSDLKLNVKSETDILIGLLEQYKSCKDEDEKLEILKDLEYISHQFDVAQDLVRLDGLDLLLPDLNSSTTDVRSLVCATLGAAMQGNPRVQIAVLEKNGLSILIRMTVLDSSLSVRAKALFAMSCLLRNFPYAQQRLIENGGVQLLTSILQEEVSSDVIALKIKIKVITLFSDLLVEEDFSQKSSSQDKTASSSIRKLLVQNNYCDLVGDLLSMPGMDIAERVVPAMIFLSSDCAFDKQTSVLHRLAKETEEQLRQEETDEEKNQLLSDIRVLLKQKPNREEL